MWKSENCIFARERTPKSSFSEFVCCIVHHLLIHIVEHTWCLPSIGCTVHIKFNLLSHLAPHLGPQFTIIVSSFFWRFFLSETSARTKRDKGPSSLHAQSYLEATPRNNTYTKQQRATEIETCAWSQATLFHHFSSVTLTSEREMNWGLTSDKKLIWYCMGAGKLWTPKIQPWALQTLSALGKQLYEQQLFHLWEKNCTQQRLRLC